MENIPAPICAMFYKVVVVAVLMYVSESRNVPKAKMMALKYFQVVSVCNLTRCARDRCHTANGTNRAPTMSCTRLTCSRWWSMCG